MQATDANEPTKGMVSLDTAMIQEGVRLILRGIGEDLDREGLVDTPSRVARMYEEMLCFSEFNSTTFENIERYSEIILVRDIPFHSLCEHHMLPFFGTATLGYIPQETYLGLSKLARAVDYFSRRLQVQERLTMQTANWLWEETQPIGVGVVLKARHMCMEARGIRKVGSETVTFSVLGSLQDDRMMRSEFLHLATSPLGL